MERKGAMNKLQILLAYFQAKRRLKWSRSQIDRWHNKRIKKIIQHAKTSSPFYQTLYGKEEEFENLPIISKKEMMESFKFFNTEGISKEEAIALAKAGEEEGTYESNIRGITVGLSSGTSGARGVFLASEKEASLWCGNILAKTLTKSIFSKQRVALFLRANSNLYETVSWLRYFNLDGIYEGIQEYDPEILVAPPSVLKKLPALFPKKVISVAEVLEPFDQAILERKFQTKIDQIYQCTEGFLGFTCRMGTLHLNEDVLHIEKEYLDKNSGRFVPILTDLCRTTQPIIRYRLDDVLIEGSCRCGSSYQAIQAVEGRLKDVLILKKKGGGSLPIFAREFEDVFSTEYLVKQTDEKTLHLYGGCKKRLLNFLEAKGVFLPTIVTHEKLPMRKDYEKLRRIQRSA